LKEEGVIQTTARVNPGSEVLIDATHRASSFSLSSVGRSHPDIASKAVSTVISDDVEIIQLILNWKIFGNGLTPDLS